MKIIIDDQYQNDENNQYTMDEDGNINLFINIDNATEQDETINFNNNIDSNSLIGGIESNFEELREEEIKDTFIVESFVKEENIIKEDNTISEENIISEESQREEEKNKRNYHSIYAEIERNLQTKYSGDDKVEYDLNNQLEYGLNNQVEYVANNQEEYDLNKKVKNQYDNPIERREEEKKGIIEVYSKLGSREGLELRGARINLYLLNGVSPKLYDSKFTDSIGKVTFNNLPNGCYRIIAIVDRRYFEKPIYYNWNEVTIDSNNKEKSIVVVNKIKSGYYR
ncbi:calcium-binding protein [Clostridium sp. Sa3CUN1]|uniref:Calcium-binding protein n=1 Tax=Clostridium gallinarum TaxID=2762246 RepID=A0ABR8Q191_9CLOT|nr:calcium-binding protein [Clostridium gallinarum]MBD7914185.1 calcium-binding protein [Clostridium gallinarum]